MIHRIDVQIVTPLNPTELPDRVRTAVRNVFPTAEIEEGHGELVARAHSLEHFRERLFQQAIVDAAREVFLENREGDAFGFALKKQPAHEGVVTFAVGNPDELGDLHVRVRVEEPDVDAFIDYLAPRTETDDRG